MAFASRAVCLVLLSLALCQAASGQSTATVQIVTTFKEITTMSGELRDVAMSIKTSNALTVGPKIGQGFQAIITRVAAASKMLSDPKMSQLSDPDAKLVVTALTDFVKVHQQLLAVVIGDHGILALVPFFTPIRVALQSLEGAVDTFAFALIRLIATESAAAQKQFDSLTVTVKLAISVYNNPLPVTKPLPVTLP